MIVYLTASTIGLVLSLPQVAFAGSATWNSAPGSGVWNIQTSWTPATIPNGPNDTATFGDASTQHVSVLANTEVNGIVFNPGAPTFSITPQPGIVLTLSGTGVENNSAWQNVVLPASDNASLPSPAVHFTNGALAGDKIYYVTDNALRQTGGGSISFYDHSSADRGAFRIDGAHDSTTANSQIEFNDQSTAANGTFFCNSGRSKGAPGAVMKINDNATVEHALIYVNGAQTVLPGEAGSLRFNGGTAGDATIIASGGLGEGTKGGFVIFSPGSKATNATITANTNGGEPGWIGLWGEGGTCRIQVFGGNLDTSGHDNSPLIIGSLEGGGNVYLGSVNLTIGSNNLSTEFFGVLQDRDRNGAGNLGGSLTKIGSGTLTLSGANLHTGGTRVDAGRLMANNSAGSATGTGFVIVHNSGSVLGGTGFITGGPVTVNPGAALSGGDATTASGSLKVTNDVTFTPNSIIELGLGPSGAHSTLSRTGGTWNFAVNQTFRFVNLGAEPGVYDNIITGLAGDPGGTASWTISNPGFGGTFTYDGAGNIDLTIAGAPSPTPAPTPTPSPTATPTPTPVQGVVGNVATRLPVGTGDNVLIEGFIVQGPVGSTKKIMVRAIGPALAGFGIDDALANPTLEIRDANNVAVATNNDWKTTQVGGIITGDQSAEISGSGLAPGDDLESAIIANLAPGSYTAVVRGVGNTVGTGVVDAYDLSAASAARLVNIATRGLIQPGDKLMIAGFIIQNGPVRAVVRAIGPSLSAFGINNALPDTTLQLRDQNGVIVKENDDWQTDQKQELEDTGLQPSHELEAGVIVTLAPGQYTAQVRGQPETTGIGVVQVYFLQ